MPRSQVLLLLVALTLQAGCQCRPMRTPVICTEGGVDPFTRLETKTRETTVQVLYATDRQPVEADDPADRHGNERGGAPRLGAATVRLGLGRSIEEITEKEEFDRREGIDVGFIDVTRAGRKAGKSALGNMCWHQNSRVITDLVMSIRYDVPAGERGLDRGAEGWLWSLSDDYPDRVRSIAQTRAGPR